MPEIEVTKEFIEWQNEQKKIEFVKEYWEQFKEDFNSVWENDAAF